jgi:hypothetical protein
MDLYNFLILLSPSILIIAALAYAAATRYIAYKERVALVERGVDIEAILRSQRLGRQGNRGILWAGTITAASGLAILSGLWRIGCRSSSGSESWPSTTSRGDRQPSTRVTAALLRSRTRPRLNLVLPEAALVSPIASRMPGRARPWCGVG